MSEPTNGRQFHQFESFLGWSAVLDDRRRVELRDTTGQLRVTYQSPSWFKARLRTTKLVEHGTHELLLAEGPVQLYNGSDWGMFKRQWNGHVELYGRRFEFRHRWWGRLDVRADGHRVVALRKTWFHGNQLRHQAIRDPLDELGAVLGWYAVTPGRDGMIHQFFMSS